MPTNKLWLEHTERAAWDSVQALREKLASAEDRLARFAPAGENWKKILDALDGVRADLGAEQESYGNLASRLAEELNRARDRVAETEREVAELRRSLETRAAVSPVAQATRADDGVASSEDPSVAKTLRRLARRLENESWPARPRARDIDNAVAAIERRLEELDDTPASGRAELTLEIAAFAVRLCILQRLRSAERS